MSGHTGLQNIALHPCDFCTFSVFFSRELVQLSSCLNQVEIYKTTNIISNCDWPTTTGSGRENVQVFLLGELIKLPRSAVGVQGAVVRLSGQTENAGPRK